MHYLVELGTDVDNRGANAFVAQCRAIPGVHKVVLLEAISRPTLDVILYQPPPSPPRLKVVRRRKSQPPLPGVA